jgi:phenylalanyl-tRNA synthetase beta chain
MKFTLGWLKTWLDTEADADTIARALTDLGLEVESVEDPSKALAPFKVAYVVEAKPHPNADKLRVCIVDTGTERLQVVCGAPNARTGMKGVFAPAGSVVPGTGLHLKPSVIRGVESNGMLCSEREMGLSNEHDGIIELPDDAPVGRPFAEVRGLDDPVFDVAITPNRQDALGVEGIARDLAAAGIGTFRAKKPPRVLGAFPCPVPVALDFPGEARPPCPLFAARLIRGVRNGPSPDWLRRRLESIGLRPISALVDVTNFLTYDRARPLHVFDAGKLVGGLVVRRGRPGEEVVGLDGKTYALDETAIAIADETGVVSIGGIMGGLSTGCDEGTTDVLLESAYFEPDAIAAAGRKLGIVSDARYRFERGVDPLSAEDGIEAATALILELCGGTPSEVQVSGKAPEWRRTIGFRPPRVQALTGIEASVDEIARILTALGFGVERGSETWQVTPPSWRRDVEGEADLVEEVARVKGFSAIPSTPLPATGVVARPAVDAAQRRARIARRALAARGLVETMNYSFVPHGHAVLFGGGDERLRLLNPMSAELDTMRPSLLPSLIVAAGRNAARGFDDVALFEVAPVYETDQPDGQLMVAAGLRRGRTGPRHWRETPRPVDAFDAKADALALLAELGVPTQNLVTSVQGPDHFHPHRKGELRLGGNILAAFGDVHPAVARALDVDGAMAGFEVYLDRIPSPRARPTRTKAALQLSDLMPLSRDFAFVVARDVAAEALVRAARGADKQLVAEVSVFDVYEGKGVPEGMKSVALAVRIEPKAATLTDKEIEAISSKIVAAVAKATGATLRA